MKDQMREMFLTLLLLRDVAIDGGDMKAADAFDEAAEILGRRLPAEEGKAA